MHDLYNLLHCSFQGFCYILDAAKQLLFLVLYINNWKVRKNMNADMKWLDNPEVFKVNQLEPHSDHCYYLDYSDMKKEKNPLLQSLNGQWEFAYSKNVMERPVDFYKETFDASGFDKIMVPGHIELAGYDKIRYINTMYP